MIVYKVTNKINGKVYIGQTKRSFKERISDHVWAVNGKSNLVFHRALRKHTKDGFRWTILEYCDSKEEMDEMEFHYIRQYDTYNNGYNSTLGGDGVFNKHSEESKRKMSISTSGKLNPMFGVPSPMTGKFGKDNHLAKKYVIITPNSERFVIHGIFNFCNIYDEETLCHSALIRVARGKQKQHKGYKCEYFEKSADLNLQHWRGC